MQNISSYSLKALVTVLILHHIKQTKVWQYTKVFCLACEYHWLNNNNNNWEFAWIKNRGSDK